MNKFNQKDILRLAVLGVPMRVIKKRWSGDQLSVGDIIYYKGIKEPYYAFNSEGSIFGFSFFYKELVPCLEPVV